MSPAASSASSASAASAPAPRLHPKTRLQHDEVRGRDVLLYPEGLVTLNATGVEILRLCDGARSLADIVATLERRYGASGLGGEVAAFLDGLAAKGLVIFGPPGGAAPGAER